MNDSIYYVECVQEYDGMLNIPEINRSLNKVPMLKLPLVYSTRMMIQEMENRFHNNFLFLAEDSNCY